VAEAPANEAPHRRLNDVEFGANVVVHPFTNLYGCRVGDNTRIGPFVEVQRGAVIGANCKIQSHTFICDGVTIEDEVFVGHGVMFVNDKFPRATRDGRPVLSSAFTRSLVDTPPRVRSTSLSRSFSRERLLVVRVAVAIRTPNRKTIVSLRG